MIESELPAPAAVVKDLVTGKGLLFGTIKTRLQTELNSIHPQ